MKRIVVAAAALAVLTGGALAAAPTSEQKDQFYKACVRNSGGNTTLCKCKADAAMTLVDAEFMAVIISSMNGATPDDKYIAASTQACGMGTAM